MELAPEEADDGADTLLSTLTQQLSDAGAKPSERTSKLATALGDSWPASKRTDREEPAATVQPSFQCSSTWTSKWPICSFRTPMSALRVTIQCTKCGHRYAESVLSCMVTGISLNRTR